MAPHNPSSNDIKQPVRKAASHPWFEKLARLGYAAKGVVYFLIGLLAFQAAFGAGEKTTDSKGALEIIVTQPFGKVLLGIVTLGLIGYALLRIVETILDPDHTHDEKGFKQIARRLGSAVSAVSYGTLAFSAIKLILGSNTSNKNSTEERTALFLSQPFGQWLVGIVGIGIISFGFYQIYKAYKNKFVKNLNLSAMNASEKSWAKRVGKIGIAARGIVFALIGIFLTKAAVSFNPNEAKGLADALASLEQQPFGSWLLAIVALGLIAYSFYLLIQAKYPKFAKINNHH